MFILISRLRAFSVGGPNFMKDKPFKSVAINYEYDFGRHIVCYLILMSLLSAMKPDWL